MTLEISAGTLDVHREQLVGRGAGKIEGEPIPYLPCVPVWSMDLYLDAHRLGAKSPRGDDPTRGA